MHDYWVKNQERLAAYQRAWRAANREEIAENKKREMRMSISHTESVYLGTVGLTRKQREKLRKELNGTTE